MGIILTLLTWYVIFTIACCGGLLLIMAYDRIKYGKYTIQPDDDDYNDYPIDNKND